MWAVRLQSVRPVSPTGLTDQSDVAGSDRPVSPTIGTCKRFIRLVGPTIVPCKRPVTVREREFQVAGAEQWKAHLPKAMLANVSDSVVAVLTDLFMLCCSRTVVCNICVSSDSVFSCRMLCQYSKTLVTTCMDSTC